MADATVSRLGQAAGAGDVRALFLKVFSGEVLTIYDAATIMKDKTRVRNISSGKSAQFPAVGGTVAEYHTPGTEILGDVIQHSEKVITIDDLLIAHTFLSNIDEAMNHYEVRSEYSKRIGEAIAKAYDRNLLSLGVRACRNTGSGLPGEGPVGQANAVSSSIGASPTIQTVVDSFYAAAQVFDENDLPAEGRCAAVPPSVYWDLVTNDKLLDKDYGNPNGDYAGGMVRKVAGFDIIATNNLAVDHTAAGNLTIAPESAHNTYTVDASDTKALCFSTEAMGTVKLMDIASEMDYQINRQGTLLVSKMAVGHGVLRPESLYEIRAA